MRLLAAGIAAFVLAACSDPANENVSPEGPTTTTTEAGDPVTTEAAETTTTAPKGPVEVARFKGSTDTDTANFKVDESWEIHWKIDLGYGAGIGVEWKNPTDEFDGGLIQPDTDEGSSLVREGGTFYLHISNYGANSWEVWIVDVPN